MVRIVKVGIVGPSNLLRKILSVVHDLDDASFVPLEYVLPHEASGLVAEHQNFLDAIFFCGSIPYCLCLDSVPRTIPWSYLPLRTTGLLVALLNAREHLRGRVRMSVDTLSENEVREGLEDCSLDIGDIYTYSCNFAHIDIDDIASFHTRLLAEKKVDICLTCVEAVHIALLRRNLPAYRVSPGRQTIRNAVERLILEVRGQSNAHLLSVVGVFRPESVFAGRRQYEEAMLKLNACLMEYAKKRGILAIPRDSLSFQTIETMGQFLIGTSNMTDATSLAALRSECGFPVTAGFGVGPSLRIAEEYAVEAADMARGREGICYLFDGKKGRIVGAPAESSLPFLYYDPEMAALAERLGVTLPTLCRYLQGLMCFDDEFTASEYAKVVGIQAKSSRKVMNALVKECLVSECGLLSHAGRGRPQRLYRAAGKVGEIRSRSRIPWGGDMEERSRV
jgi:hypothetical protein